jgi:hypothetical protein
MRRFALLGVVLLAAPSLAFAHVSVRPRESKAGAESDTPSGCRPKERSRRHMCNWRFLQV